MWMPILLRGINVFKIIYLTYFSILKYSVNVKTDSIPIVIKCGRMFF